MSANIPRKALYKLGEVCQLTDTQPYVLRFWESEFPQLAPRKSRTGQRLYRQKDVDLVLQIKRLLYEDGFTIASARKKLGLGGGEGPLDDLFDPAPVDEPERLPEPVRPLGTVISTVSQNLEEILEIMEATDRRLREKK
jgi:DNA-binding transcriptional MerR regulator